MYNTTSSIIGKYITLTFPELWISSRSVHSCRLEEVGSFVLLGVQYLTRLRIICPTRNVEIKLAEKSDPF